MSELKTVENITAKSGTAEDVWRPAYIWLLNQVIQSDFSASFPLLIFIL